MRYCYHCNHLNTGKPRYCQYCAHTFNIKFCPKGHINPPDNLVCGECGLSDFSEPALPPRWIRMLKGILKLSFLIIVLLQLKIIIAVLILAFVLWLCLIAIVNVCNEILPSPLNKILSAVGRIIKGIFAEEKSNKSGTKRS